MACSVIGFCGFFRQLAVMGGGCAPHALFLLLMYRDIYPCLLPADLKGHYSVTLSVPYQYRYFECVFECVLRQLQDDLFCYS
jgi:hypothetical protein